MDAFVKQTLEDIIAPQMSTKPTQMTLEIQVRLEKEMNKLYSYFAICKVAYESGISFNALELRSF